MRLAFVSHSVLIVVGLTETAVPAASGRKETLDASTNLGRVDALIDVSCIRLCGPIELIEGPGDCLTPSRSSTYRSSISQFFWTFPCPLRYRPTWIHFRNDISFWHIWAIMDPNEVSGWRRSAHWKRCDSGLQVFSHHCLPGGILSKKGPAKAHYVPGMFHGTRLTP
jgi:hypothetical protein